MGDFSTNSPKVTIFGGTGFLGRYVVQRLARQGWIINIVSRNPSKGLFLKTQGSIGQINLIKGDFLYIESLKDSLEGSNAIINCVGILDESNDQKFKLLHSEVPGQLAKYASQFGVGQFIHISSIGADENSESHYAKTKGVGEARIRDGFPEAKILRSSVMFGAEDKFFNLFALIASLSPVIPMVGGQTLFQPVYVDDVACAVEKLLYPNLKSKNELIFELGGSEVLSFRNLMAKMLFLIQRKRILLDIPFGIADIFCPLVYMANKLTLNNIPLLITKDKIRQLKKDNIVSKDIPGFNELAISPRVLDAILPTYLNRYRPKGQFNDL